MRLFSQRVWAPHPSGPLGHRPPESVCLQEGMSMRAPPPLPQVPAPRADVGLFIGQLLDVLLPPGRLGLQQEVT